MAHLPCPCGNRLWNGCAGEETECYFVENDVLEAHRDDFAFFELQFNPAGLLRGTEHFFTGTELRLDADGLWTEWDKVGERQDCILSGLRHAAGMLRDGEGRVCGWFVEAALPAEELLRRTGRGSFEAGKRLLANFVRYDYAAGKAEPDMVFWSATVSGRPHRSPGRFGTLLLLPR